MAHIQQKYLYNCTANACTDINFHIAPSWETIIQHLHSNGLLLGVIVWFYLMQGRLDLKILFQDGVAKTEQILDSVSVLANITV